MGFLIRATAWLGRPRVVLWAVAVGALLVAPSLWIGLHADDYSLRMAALGFPGLPDLGMSPLEAFNFADGIPAHNRIRIDYALIPWWTPEDANLSFFRPLSALTHYIDFRFLGRAWWLMHLHSLFWYGALCAAVALLYRRMHAIPCVAGLAAMLYAVDDAHGIPVGWLSNRNALLTTLFGVLVLIAHDVGRRKDWRLGPLALAALAIGLGCGEATLSVGGYLFAYAVFLDKGSYKQRAISLVPYGMLVLVYLIFYRSNGFGTGVSGLYRDPFSQPGDFLRAVARHLPALLHGQLGLLPANIYPLLSPQWQLVHSAVSAVAVVIFFFILLPLLRSDPVARFWALGMVLATLPVCPTVPGERLLCFTGIGAMGLVAQYIARGIETWNLGKPSWRRTTEHTAVGFFVAAHCIIAPLSMPFSSVSVAIFGGALERGVAKLDASPEVTGKSLVLLRAPVDVFPSSVRDMRLVTGEPIPRHTWALSVGLDAVKVTRVDERTLQVWTEGGFFPFPYGTTLRGTRKPFSPDDVFAVDGFTATVQSINDDRRPLEIRFQFNIPLDDPSLLWYTAGPRGPEQCDPPAVGKTLYIPPDDPFKWLMSE